MKMEPMDKDLALTLDDLFPGQTKSQGALMQVA